MLRAWDAGWNPQLASYSNESNLSQPWDPQTQGWTCQWLRELRTSRIDGGGLGPGAAPAVGVSEMQAAAQKRRQEAINRFWSGGELRLCLDPAHPTLHTPALRAQLPSTLAVTGEEPDIGSFLAGLKESGWPVKGGSSPRGGSKCRPCSALSSSAPSHWFSEPG